MHKRKILFAVLFLFFVPSVSTDAGPSEKTLYLILPFENRNAERSCYWISEALSDLISQVVEEKGEKFVPRRERNDTYAAFGFSPIASPTLASQLKIAEQLQATHLIYGSFDFRDNLLKIQGSLINLQKPSLIHTFALTTGVNDLLTFKKVICEKFFPKKNAAPSCPDSLQTDYGEKITIQAYEAFIKASLEDSSAMKEELYQKALKLSPSFTRVFYELGFLYFRNSQYDLAEENLKLITDKKSKISADACLLLGTIYLESERLVLAIDILKKAVVYGGTGRAHFLLAKAYAMNGDAENTMKELDISMKLDPADIEARSFKKELERKK